MADSLIAESLGGVELPDAERKVLAALIDSDADGEEVAKVISVWIAASSFHTADPNGIGIDVVHQGLERIAEVAKDANKPLHRNSMRVDWANALGAGERAYVEGLRGSLGECERLAYELIERGKQACSCDREPGTDPDCPLHQIEPQVT